MERGHPPLRRVGRAVVVDPSLQMPSGGDCTSSVDGGLDSCYSSCSEDAVSHASLSREASETLAAELARSCSVRSGSSGCSQKSDSERTPRAPRRISDLRAFGVLLGFAEIQVALALEALGNNATQEALLSELVRQGRAEGAAEGAAASASNVSPGTPLAPPPGDSPLRAIVIDGSNIAFTHGRREVFSCGGIRECVSFFESRGHSDILVFIPQFRREQPRADSPITDQHILEQLDRKGVIVWTPSRRVNGRRIVCHDDRYILRTAWEKDGVVVSNDEFRELAREDAQYAFIAQHRLLMYSFVDGKFMPPDDPLGRRGPSLDEFLSRAPVSLPLSRTQNCPYARKCTYGNKCKYLHPERPNGLHVSLTQRLLNEKGGKQRNCLSARNSGEPSTPFIRDPLARANSLDICILPSAAPPQIHQRKPSAIPCHMQPQHMSLVRNRSAPLGGTPEVVPSRQNTLGQSFSSQLFAPSTAVWGQSEFSMGPLTRDASTPRDLSESLQPPERARLAYHLSHLFPAAAVSAVMQAHPAENDPRRLCERILELQRGFDPSH